MWNPNASVASRPVVTSSPMGFGPSVALAPQPTPPSTNALFSPHSEGKHHTNEEEVAGHATGHGLLHTVARKGFGGLLSLWIGGMEGYSGELTVMDQTGKPGSGWGVKGIIAALFNGIEFIQLFAGAHFGKYGYVGTAVDAGIEGFADAGWYLWLFGLANDAGVAKRNKEGQKPAGTAGTGVDYDRRRKELAAAQERQRIAKERESDAARRGMSERVQRAQRVAQESPFHGML
jgi:hypothetical protein